MTETTAPTATESAGLRREDEGHGLRRVLGLPSLVFFGMAYMAPLTVFTTYGVVTAETGGHLPMAYVFTLLTMMFTAFNYGQMSQRIPLAGSAYTYSSVAFGEKFGFLVGWALLLDYLFLPMINYLAAGMFFGAYFPDIPKEFWMVTFMVLVFTFNILGVKWLSRSNFVTVGMQLFCVVFFMVAALVFVSDNPPPSLSAPFWDEETQFSAVAAGAAILCLSFLGFDAVSTLSEEAVDSKKNIPRAIMLCTFICGSLFIATAYFGHIVFPDWQNFEDMEAGGVEVIKKTGSQFVYVWMIATTFAACAASAMASQASVSRILYAMGRDGVLPKSVFGVIWQRFGTPARATCVVSVLSLAAFAISLELAATVISFGALIGFFFVNLAVPRVFLRHKANRTPIGWLRYGVIPAIGTLLTIWLWTSLSAEAFKIGLLWLAIGLAWIAWITRGFMKPMPKMFFEES